MSNIPTIVFYGDSETAAFGWTDFIQQGANAAGVALNLVNTAVGGKNVSWGLANLQANAINYQPAAVVFEFSMNDVNGLTLQQASILTQAMIIEIEQQSPNTKIFLATNNDPTPIGFGNLFIAENVAANFAQYRAIASQYHVGLIDNEATFAPAITANPLIVPDGVHPTAAADTLYEIPNDMTALGLSFPVYDVADHVMAVPRTAAPAVLVFANMVGLPVDLPTLDNVAKQDPTNLANFFLAMSGTHPTNIQELVAVESSALGRAPTAAEVAQYTAPGVTLAQIVVGVATSQKSLHHAASWLAVF